MQRQIGLGVFMIGIGTLILLAQQGWLGEHLVLYFLAVSFFSLYKFLGGANHYGNVGLLIPGLVLAAVALFATLEENLATAFLGPGLFFVLLSGAFCAVYLVHTRRAGGDWGRTKWPLIPASVLAGVAVLTSISEQLHTWRQSQFFSWIAPAALILVGLYLVLFKDTRRNR